MIKLPCVTLCCVDTRTPQLALNALARSCENIRFAEVQLFTDEALCPAAPPGVRIVDTRVNSVEAYSALLLKGLLQHVHTSHLLIVQWDGYVLHPQAWDPAFLEYDYIGAPWPWFQDDLGVGNGGFSLRSRRLLQALQDPRIVTGEPEDVVICQTYRALLEREHGIRFAPRALAERFAFERGTPAQPTFGFHGLFNLHRVLPPEELQTLLATLPPSMAVGMDARDLCKALIRSGALDSARMLLHKRRALGMFDKGTLQLMAKLAWARMRL